MLGNLSGKMRGSEATTVEASGSSGSVPDAVMDIKRYKELLDMGAITEEEFEAKKKQLLNGELFVYALYCVVYQGCRTKHSEHKI